MATHALSVRKWVNTDRYPVDDLANPARDELVAMCREQLDASAICCLPDFIRPDGLAQMIKEMRALEPVALKNNLLRTAYSWMDNSGFPPDHPRSAVFLRRFSYLVTDQIPEDSLSRALFFWDPLTDFVRDALGFKTLYRSECPTVSIQANYMNEGDVLPWHFDTNDGVVSLLLDEADEGGHYQMAPYVRDEDNEHYDRVTRAFNEDPDVIVEPRMPPGTFILFKGRRSVHRVSPVGRTTKPRMIMLYSYDEKPGMVFPQKSQDRMRYPDSTPYYGHGTPADATGFKLWSVEKATGSQRD